MRQDILFLQESFTGNKTSREIAKSYLPLRNGNITAPLPHFPADFHFVPPALYPDLSFSSNSGMVKTQPKHLAIFCRANTCRSSPYALATQSESTISFKPN